MPLEVELAEERDVPAIEALFSDTESPFDVRAELARRYARLWVVRQDGLAIAFLLAWQLADEVELLDLVVSPAHRRKGVAQALVSALLAFASDVRARHVLLEVRKSNEAAIALYRCFAFEPSGERSNYYSDGEAALLMTREVW